MPRAARSSKKQADFDPNELADLIHHSAVGTGVGLVLLEAIKDSADPAQTGNKENENEKLEHFCSVQAKESVTSLLEATTVDTFVESTMDSTVSTQLAESPDLDNKSDLDNTLSNVELSTSTAMTTVVNSIMTTVGPATTIDYQQYRFCDSMVPELLAIPELPDSALAVKPPYTPEASPVESSEQGREAGIKEEPSAEATLGQEQTVPMLRAREVKLWITEQGELIPNARVKKISRAQDVLNSAEETVYNTLWTAKIVQYEGDNSSRIVQAGYHYLAKQTRLSKKTIQRIVDKLIYKGFLAIEHQADIYTRASTIYRVFSCTAVQERQKTDKRFYFAKIGPGFSYVHEYLPTHLTTVVDSKLSPMVTSLLPTGDKPTTRTETCADLSTMVRQTTKYEDRNVLGEATSLGVYRSLSEYGQVDDKVVNRLIDKCTQVAADCTEDEIVHFVHQKGQLVRGKGSEVYSPIGFLVTAVPKCLSGESFRQYREDQRKRREEEAAKEARRRAELAEWKREQEARLSDPNVPEEEKEFICQCLGLR